MQAHKLHSQGDPPPVVASRPLPQRRPYLDRILTQIGTAQQHGRPWASSSCLAVLLSAVSGVSLAGLIECQGDRMTSKTANERKDHAHKHRHSSLSGAPQ